MRKILYVMLISMLLILAAGCSSGGGGSSDSDNENNTTNTNGTDTATDTTAPTTPTNLIATAVSSSQINLCWDASTDNVGVRGYKIYKGGVYLKSVTGVTTSDTGLSAGREYCYKVQAYDTSLNESSQSIASCATTLVSNVLTDRISGTVTLNSVGVAGVTVNLTGISSGTHSASTTTDASGNYGFGTVVNGEYIITASKTGYAFSPASISRTINDANITGLDFSSNTYISGAVTSSNVCLTGVTVTLTGIGYNSVTTDADGNYNFIVDVNGNYTITPSMTGYTFSPTSIDTTVNNVNITGRNFTVASFPSGSLDATFGTCGIVTTPVGSSDDYAYLLGANALGIQSDGKIIAAGVSNNGRNTDFALVRYNSNGSLDETFGTFGTSGIVNTDITISGKNYSDYAPALGIQSDGKIVLAGTTSTGNNSYFALVRYNANGSLDSTFGIGGMVTTDMGYNAYAYDLGIQTDGKIVVAGDSYSSKYNITLLRYNSNGSLDSTFGTGGKLTTNIGNYESHARALSIQSDGKIVVAGYYFNGNTKLWDFVLVRYNTNGSLDTSFGTGGVVTTDTGSFVVALEVLSDGKIVAGGYSDFTLVRYNANGSLDSTFGTGGMVTTDISESFTDNSRALSIQSDGKIVVAGSTYYTGYFALVRYWP